MDESDRYNRLQELLMDKYVETIAKRKRPMSQNEFARKVLGVGPASYSNWITGTRLPDYQNCIILAKTLGPEIFDIVGYPRVPNYADSKIQFIAERWTSLSEEARREIYDHVREEISSKNGGGTA